MPTSATQFWGLESVLKAYTSMGVAPFALMLGKQLLFTCNSSDINHGAAILNDYLKMMGESGAQSYATYTLRVYDGLGDDDKIKAGTDYSGSFNFSMFEPDGAPGQRGTSRVKQLEERIRQLEDGDEDASDRPSGIAGILDTMISRPEIQQMIFSTIANFVQNMIKNFGIPGPTVEPLPAPVGRIAGTGDLAAASVDATPLVDPLARLNTALETIAEVDPDIVLHLEKLAKMAKETPDQFKFLLTFLK